MAKKDLKKYATYYNPRFYSNGMDLEKWLSRKDTIFSKTLFPNSYLTPKDAPLPAVLPC